MNLRKFLLLAFLFCGVSAKAANSPLFKYDGDYQGRLVVTTRDLPDGHNVRRTIPIYKAEFKAAPHVAQGGLELIHGNFREHLSFRHSTFEYKRTQNGSTVTLYGTAKIRPFSVSYSASTSDGAVASGFLERISGASKVLKVVIDYRTPSRLETLIYFLYPTGE
jgi:hypothetical protein